MDLARENVEKSQSTTAVFELTLAGALWGFGFIAVAWALEAMGTLAITGWRFAIACAVGFAIIGVSPRMRRTLNWTTFRLAIIPGLLISSSLIAQTWGLRSTTATKSGFITVLYVLIVPFLEKVWLKRAAPRHHVWYVLGALVGVALICNLPALFTEGGQLGSAKERLNIGDAWTFVCAILAALHIVWFGRIGDQIESPFVFNTFQSFWAGAIPLALSFVLESPPHFETLKPMIGLGMLAFGSTLIAFALQIRAQKKVSPSVASLLFLLESPFAAFFAIVFLGESLSAIEITGCAVILLSLALSVVFNRESSEPVSGPS